MEKEGKNLDPYVKVGIGASHQWNSKTIKKGSLNNDFKNEQKKFSLTSKDSTIIIFQFFDKRALSTDRMLGSASYDLKTHKQDSVTASLKLMTDKKKQLGTINATIFFKESTPPAAQIPKLPAFVTP